MTAARKKGSDEIENSNRIAEQIAEISAKIQLIEGDRRAFAESSQFTAKNNDAKILALKKENKELIRKYKTCITCDEDTLNQVFPGHDVGKQAFVGKLPEDTITGLNNKKCDQIKRLNLAQYRTRQKEEELVELIERMKGLHEFAEHLNRRDRSPNSQKAKNRMITTDIEKYKLKNTEADEVQKYFFKIARRLGEENKLYESHLDKLDELIDESEEELRGLQEMNRDAENSKEAAKLDLQLQDEQIQREKFARDKQKGEVKRTGDMRQANMDKLNSLVSQQESMNQEKEQEEELDNQAYKDQVAKAEDAEKRISNYEQACQKIKDATGLHDTGEAIDYFKNQFATKDNLESQIENNQEKIGELEDRKRDLQENFEDIKYQGDDDDSDILSSQAETSETQFDADKARMSLADKKLIGTQKTISDLKTAVDHLNEKLSVIEVPRKPRLSLLDRKKEQEYLLDTLDLCAEKIRELLDEIGEDTDVDEVLKEIEDSEFNNLVQDKIPPSNVRVSLKGRQKPTFDDDEDEEILETEDEDDVPTRNDVKRASSSLIESKMNRRGNKKAAMKFR